MSRFTITDTVSEVVRCLKENDTEMAGNYASLVLWRVEHHGSWLTDSEHSLVAKLIPNVPKARRRRRN